MDICNFKRAIHKLNIMDQFSIDNLARYLDTNNDGLISTSNLVA